MGRSPSVARPLRASDAPHQRQRVLISKRLHLLKKIPNQSFLKGAKEEGFTHVNLKGRWQRIDKAKFCQHGGDRKKSLSRERRTIISTEPAKTPLRRRPRHVVKLVESTSKAVARKVKASIRTKAKAGLPVFKFKDTVAMIVNVPEAKLSKTMAKGHLCGLVHRVICPRGICGRDFVSKVCSEKNNKAWHTLTLSQAGQRNFGSATARVHCANPDKAAGVWGCTQSHLKAVQAAQRLTTCSPRDFIAFFEDDVYFTAQRTDVAFIVETLLANAEVDPDLMWIGCIVKGKNLPKEKVLASMRYGGQTLQLREIAGAYCTHAFLLRRNCLAAFAQQLRLGHSADGALNRACKEKVQVVVTQPSGKLVKLAKQLPSSKILDGDRIHGVRRTL